jgi:hypothetical protein
MAHGDHPRRERRDRRSSPKVGRTADTTARAAERTARAAAGSVGGPAARAPARASSPGRAVGERRRRAGGSRSAEAARWFSIAEISAAAAMARDLQSTELPTERSGRRIDSPPVLDLDPCEGFVLVSLRGEREGVGRCVRGGAGWGGGGGGGGGAGGEAGPGGMAMRRLRGPFIFF